MEASRLLPVLSMFLVSRRPLFFVKRGTMNKTELFTIRLSPDERAIIHELAQRLRRTEADALRLVAREVVYAMRAEENRAMLPAFANPTNAEQPA